ncbi:hypothetical protein F5882DRAFT_296566, partial [Hyaloscypha sp. PMI_1271]
QRHHQRQECKELLKMMFPKTVMMRIDEEYMPQSREERRVVRGNLMHQLQIAYALRDASQKSTFMHNPPRGMICLHVTIRRSLQNINCGATEYRLDKKGCPGYGLLIFLTKWKDLGDGPESEVWTRHSLPRPAFLFREAFVFVGLAPQVELIFCF